MPLGLDHLVLAVHDLDAAGRFYEALGFTVGQRNRHPWGTENRIVQFPGVFLELITVGEGAAIAPHADGAFSFGAFVRDSLARREGLAMVVLESRDARHDRDRFAAEHIGDFAPFDFERQAKRPDGTAVRVAFSLAFARSRLAPEAGTFVCQQHAPENFWNPAFQRHANGATGVAAVTMIAENPADHAEFLSAFTAQRDLVSHSGGIRVPLPRGSIAVEDATRFAYETGLRVADQPARWVGFTVTVPDVGAVASRLGAAGIGFQSVHGSVVVGPEAGFGTILRFQAA